MVIQELSSSQRLFWLRSVWIQNSSGFFPGGSDGEDAGGDATCFREMVAIPCCRFWLSMGLHVYRRLCVNFRNSSNPVDRFQGRLNSRALDLGRPDR